MTSIYSGQLYRGFVTDLNVSRLENYDVNRYQRTIQQQSAQGQREKELKDGLEYHQAIMADLQTKLTEVTEKLNNLYNRYMENQVAFLKPKGSYPATSTQNAVAGLPRVDDPTYGNTSGYPAGSSGILPFDDYDKIRNYSYNPYFGSKAIDQSDKTLNRTFWEEPGKTDEQAYRENGAFWETISYLWGWDVDRINATYVTGDSIDKKENRQINVTALQPNKPQYPPLKVGDRFPLNWTGSGTTAPYPAVNISGIRPGGADYSHASDTIKTGGDPTALTVTATVFDGNGTPGNPIRVSSAASFAIGDVITVLKNDDPLNPVTVTITNIDYTNNLIYTNSPAGSNNSSGTISKNTGINTGGANLDVLGKDEVNMGWEFDDLPLAMEVLSVENRPDGTTVPTSYHVVYDIPPTHPFYDQLKVLNGTEPQVQDAPARFEKDKITNAGFDYTGTAFIPGTSSSDFTYSAPYHSSGVVGPDPHPNGTEGEFRPPKNFTGQLLGSIVLNTCNPISINTNTSISMKYRFAVHQHPFEPGSPGDETLPIPPDSGFYDGHDWNSAGNEQLGGTGATYSVPNPLANNLPYSVVTNAPMGAGPVLIGTSPTPRNLSHDGYNPAGQYETMTAEIVQSGSNQVTLNFYFTGDINAANVEVQDVQIVTYNSSPGGLNTWEQGLYQNDAPGVNANPEVGMGNFSAPGVQGPLNPGDSDVINKYFPNVFQFTQFTDSYNISHTASDKNDILRSPWEFAMLDIANGSGLSGEMSIDINGQRINIDHDKLQSTVDGWAEASTAVSNPGGDYIASAAVQAATDFAATVVYPDDACGTMDHDQQFTDSDPLNNANLRTDTLVDEILENEPQTAPLNAGTGITPLDPGRTSNPTYTYNSFGAFYDDTNLGPPASQFSSGDNFIMGGSNDTTGTVDRVHASDGNFGLQLSIPTSDVNVLKNENNVLFNFGSIPDRDYSINIKDANMYVRTVAGYNTVPRYRVDAGGNIYDQFGKGYYDSTLPTDLASIGRLYTASPGSTNAQISNADHTYGAYNTAYNMGAGSFESFVDSHDRLSMGNVAGTVDNDDYNLFDYTPDLSLNPASKEGGTFGETYVGSLPSNFYYYRETMDVSGSETGTAPPTGNQPALGLNFNNDDRAALNFDGHGDNPYGTYNAPHTYVYNTDMPAFTNVSLGVVEQDARYSNTARTGSYAVWQDFPGLNAPLSYAQAVDTPPTTNVTNAYAALGESPSDFASLGINTSTLQVDMGQPVNNAGYLVLNEMGPNGPEAHEIPLPLLSLAAPYPSYSGQTPTSYSFDAYGAGTVTRTGSKFLNFQDALDEADGNDDGSSNVSVLTAAGGQFATGGPANVGNVPSWPQGVLLHVDDATPFDLTYPKNVITFGTDPTHYVIAYRDTTTTPQSMYVVREDGANMGTTITGATTVAGFVQADLQIHELTGTYTVAVTDAAGALDINGTHVKISYNANNTQREGKVVSVGLSGAMDRVGRIPGNDPRTPATETLGIGPELFDSPKGYVQPDAQVDVHLVPKDKDGNNKPRKLVSVTVETASGEQIIPSNLLQNYITNGTAADYSLNGGGGAGNNWPIAIYDGNTQINPLVTSDINYYLGYYQGITAGSTKTVVNVVNASDFKVGMKVTVNGEQRLITSIAGNAVTLDKALSNVPIVGDRLDMGDGTGESDLKLFLNRSPAMSMGAGLKVTMNYEEYEYTGYPPTVDKTKVHNVTEALGYGDLKPKDVLTIDPTNTGDGSPGNGIKVTGSLASYAVGDIINVNGDTFKIKAKTATTLELGDYINNNALTGYAPNYPIAPKSGTISHTNYENDLVTGKGRSGGSADNDFTNELKRIVDNPEYKELFRHNLFKDIFITASVNDPFNDLIASKLFLNWDRIKRQIEIDQSSFMAYWKSGV